MISLIVGICLVLLLYPFVVLLTAKLVAYGWCRGKEEFHNQEKPNGNTREEKEETRTSLR